MRTNMARCMHCAGHDPTRWRRARCSSAWESTNVSDERTDFDSLVMPHLADALALARWLTTNRADAEDVVQEACLKAFRSIHSCAGSNPRAWVFSIVRNTAYSWLEKN